MLLGSDTVIASLVEVVEGELVKKDEAPPPKLLNTLGIANASWIMPQAPNSKIAISPKTAIVWRKKSLTGVFAVFTSCVSMTGSYHSQLALSRL